MNEHELRKLSDVELARLYEFMLGFEMEKTETFITLQEIARQELVERGLEFDP